MICSTYQIQLCPNKIQCVIITFYPCPNFPYKLRNCNELRLYEIDFLTVVKMSTLVFWAVTPKSIYFRRENLRSHILNVCAEAHCKSPRRYNTEDQQRQ